MMVSVMAAAATPQASHPVGAQELELKIRKFEARLRLRPNLSLAVENPAIAWHQNSRQPEIKFQRRWCKGCSESQAALGRTGRRSQASATHRPCLAVAVEVFFAITDIGLRNSRPDPNNTVTHRTSFPIAERRTLVKPRTHSCVASAILWEVT